MPAPTKIVKGYGLLSKLEASYNAGGSPSTSTDGILLEELATLKITPANDGARPGPPGTGGYQKRVVPSGHFADISAKFAPKGAGAAYSASVVPNIHTLLRSSLMNGAVTTTAGSEKWEYTPCAITDTLASLVQSFYARGQLYAPQGILGDWTLTIDGPSVPMLDWHGMGLMPTLPTDITLPSITYPLASVDPPKATNIAFTYGAFTPVLRKLSLKWGRRLAPRLDVNSGGHAGFWGVTRTPQLDVEFETPAAATSDWFGAFSTANQTTWTLTVGSVQYNKYTIFGPAAQPMAFPEESADGDVSITKVSLQLNPSAIGANDELTWRFN